MKQRFVRHFLCEHNTVFHFCWYAGGVYDPFPFAGIWFGVVFNVGNTHVQTECVA